MAAAAALKPSWWARARPPLIVLLVLLAAWEAAARLHLYPDFLFKGPLDAARSLVGLAQAGQLWPSLRATMVRLVLSFALSLLLGAVLAGLLVLLPWLRRGVQPLLLGLQSVPGIAWVPLAILWFGFHEEALTFVTVVGSLFSITMGFVDAFALVPPLYAKAGRTMGVKGASLLLRVTIPAATPHLLSSAKVGWAFAWRSLLGAEIVFASVGLGFLLTQGREALNVAQVFGAMVLVILFGTVFDRLIFARLERRVRRRWGLAVER